MSSRKAFSLAVLVMLVGCAPAARRETPDLGRVAGPAEIAGWDISIAPDGTGLPPGRGTALVGATVYEQKCQACHGAKGAGQPNDRLVGGQGTLASKAPVRTIGSYWPYATTVFDYIRRAMPPSAPGSLQSDEIYGLVAYLLFLNDLIPADAVMDATSLAKVIMPARDRFVPDPRGGPKSVKPRSRP